MRFNWASALFLLPVCAFAQATGTISGTVYDRSGAVVPDTQVTITNTGTGLTRRVQAGGAGQFVVNLLPVGTYDLTAERAGFAASVRKGVELQVNTTVQITFELDIRSTAEQVTVAGQADLVQATSTTLVQVVDQRRVQDLPLNGRNVLQLMTLNAGVTTDNAGGGTGQIQNMGSAVTASINGSRGNGTNFLLDNGDHNDSYVNIALPFPNPDAVQEFSIQASTFDAQYGRGTGGVVNVVTKSGTNQFHGSLFEYMRNFRMNAANFFSGRDTLKRNQFGGSFGGPVIKDRTFFFASYQGTRIRTSTPAALRTTPTDAMKRGDFSEWLRANGQGAVRDPLDPAMRFPGNIIPATRFNPVTQKMLALMPASAPGANYQIRISTPVASNRDDQFVARGDHQFTANQRLSGRYFRYNITSPWTFAPGNLYFFQAGQDALAQNASMNYTNVMTPKLINDFTFTYNRAAQNSLPPAQLKEYTFAAFGAQVRSPETQPYMVANITGWSGLNLGQGYFQFQKNYQFANTLSYATGRHNLKAGGDFRRYSLPKGSPFQSGGAATFNGQMFSERGLVNAGNAFSEFVMGKMSNWTQRSEWEELLTNNYIGLFIQEDMRITNRLTANLGLRWDPRADFRERDGKQMTFLAGTQSTRFPNAFRGLQFLGDAEIPNRATQTDWNNLAPRVGIAYQITSKTVVRSAYGIFYDQAQGIINNRVGSGEPFIRLFDFIGPLDVDRPYGSGPVFDPSPLLPDRNFRFSNYTTWAVPAREMPSAYMQNWNLILERQVLGNTLVRTGYVGSKGTRLQMTAEINPAIFSATANASNINQRRIHQPIGGLQLATNNAWSSYHSLQVTVQRRWSRGFTVLGNYTWSKSIDPVSASNGNGHNTGPDPFNYNRNQGLSDFDVPHRLVISGLWESPSFSSRPAIVRAVLGGWQNNFIFTAQSGVPFTVTSGVDNNFSGVGGQFADLTGVDWRISEDRAKADRIVRWFNTAAFRTNALGTVGTGARNQLRNPGLWEADYSLFKSFPVTERITLQFRGELFNAFNHANFGGPSAAVNSVTFGRITSARTPRIAQLALRLAF
ncbi:MAG: TonB-dependent receptor [Acidobacteria bacterium]|nr:TonB-dependent receptor [Acidobacteriota bacterium]